MPSWLTGARPGSLSCNTAHLRRGLLSGSLDLFAASETDATSALHWPDVRAWLQAHPQTLLDDRSLLEEVGMEQVAAALDERVEWLCRGLGDLGGVDILSPTTAERRAGILTFRLHGWDNAALFERLKAAQVVCALRGGGIRFSPHFYTPQRVIDETLALLHELASH